MRGKPTILFIAITPPEYIPINMRPYGIPRSFQLHAHKHSVLALTAWLRKHKSEGQYIWINAVDDEGISDVFKKIDEVKPHAVGFSLTTEEFMLHYSLIELIKARYPELPVIVGGPHVTHEPFHTIQTFPDIDYVCIGEGEITLTEWLTRIADGKKKEDMRDIAGLAFRDSSWGVVTTAPRKKFDDLNVLPDPAYDLIASPDDPDNVHKVFPISASYGCRYFCTFCSVPHGSYRYIKPERMVSQIEHAIETYGVSYFAIRDSFWPPSSEWLNEFCDLVERKELKFQFHFETRAGTLTYGQILRLKLIGCQAIAVGVESGDADMLKAIKKGITPDMARKTFANLHRAGIPSIAFFMIGNQGENFDTVEKTVEFMHELNPTIMTLSTFIPFPGSEAFGLVKDGDRHWWMSGRRVSICDISIEDLARVREDIHIRYPLRLGYLKQNVYGGRLPKPFRKIAMNTFRIHLRKYLLGISERYPVCRYAIRGVKKLVRRYG